MKQKYYLIIYAMLSLAWLDPYHDEVEIGNREFHAKNYEKAQEHYGFATPYAPNEKEKNKLGFNQGDARYMRGDYGTAVEHFKRALLSEDREVQKKAYLNMGNAHLRKGETEEAINAYISALKIDPAYEKAKKNLEYILKKKDQDKDKKNQGDKSSDRDKDQSKEDDSRDDSPRGRQGEGKDRRDTGTISKEQMMNILKSMQNKPVRRMKGKDDGKRVLDKPW